MKHAFPMMLVFCLLLTGCGGAAVPAGTEAAIEEHGTVPNSPPVLLGRESVQNDAVIVAMPIAQRAEDVDNGREAIVKTLTSEEIDQIEIYAELCAVVLEQSAGDQFEAVFSFPRITAPNYRKHFDLGLTRNGNIVSISTDYENGRWDTAFEPISGFDRDQYRENAVLTVRLPDQLYNKVSLNLVTAGMTLDISGVDISAVEVRIGTGNVVIQTDRAYENLSISHMAGNITLRTPELGRRLHVSSKIGVFTLSLPEEPASFMLEISYDEDAVRAGDDAIYVLPESWNASVTGHTVHCERGDAAKSILVANQLYGVFAVEIDGTATGEPASAR